MGGGQVIGRVPWERVLGPWLFFSLFFASWQPWGDTFLYCSPQLWCAASSQAPKPCSNWPWAETLEIGSQNTHFPPQPPSFSCLPPFISFIPESLSWFISGICYSSRQRTNVRQMEAIAWQKLLHNSLRAGWRVAGGLEYSTSWRGDVSASWTASAVSSVLVLA